MYSLTEGQPKEYRVSKYTYHAAKYFPVCDNAEHCDEVYRHGVPENR